MEQHAPQGAVVVSTSITSITLCPRALPAPGQLVLVAKQPRGRTRLLMGWSDRKRAGQKKATQSEESRSEHSQHHTSEYCIRTGEVR